jgi:hypothetical protein
MKKLKILFLKYKDLMNYLQICVIIMWLINIQIYSFMYFFKNVKWVLTR